MIAHLLLLEPWILAPVVFGILTIFGRKGKKGEKEDAEVKAGTNSASTVQNPQEQKSPEQKPSTPLVSYPRAPLPQAAPIQKPTPIANPRSYGTVPDSSAPTTTPEETSLNKLLQSLLQDVPFSPPPPEDETVQGPSSTPDWVPPRATPLSRPMVLTPGGKALTPAEPEPTPTRTPAPSRPEYRPSTEIPKPPAPPAPTPTKTVKPPEPEPKPIVETPKPSPPPQPKPAREEEVKKPSKPEKLEKQEAKPQPPTRKTAQGFDHIFDITQGTLKSPGLIIINGTSSSGKTSLATNLAGACLKTGTPCLMVTFDQSPTTLRDKAKETGWDATEYEAQFRLLIVDGYSGQSESFSMEPYYIEKPLDIDNVAETLLKNCQVFISGNVQVILDSLTGLATKVSQKEFLSKFQDLVAKMKEAGSTLIVTVDASKLARDVTGSLEDLASCVIDLERDSENNGQLKVRRLNGSDSRSEPESFEIEPGKGLLFA